MAIENTLVGSILPNYSLLEEYPLYIIGEIFLHIERDLRDLCEGRSSPVSIAKDWINLDADIVIDHLMYDVHEVLMGNIAAQSVDSHKTWSAVGNSAAIFAFNDKLVTTKRLLQSGANPNKTLLWEDVLLDWVKMSQL